MTHLFMSGGRAPASGSVKSCEIMIKEGKWSRMSGGETPASGDENPAKNKGVSDGNQTETGKEWNSGVVY